ncbi:uncharacterized protein F4817DRAFT_313729 [Daldinia loculata]|uniref:uncharacterized protein n=1 Tax=Daldinia loculata TaxID=103429 RepID=UPI0020C4BCB3|nr:uncharacterized protein F4817DRAFT_313729 [Daldinia loculata]KAI1649588.1 hypothetical protein F4817DRAFT_313729 [Daldinia loculata]
MPLFDKAKISKEEFYAYAYVRNFQETQQDEVEDSLLYSPNGKVQQNNLLPIENLIEGVADNTKRERLGKNLLDSFALIFEQPGSQGAVAVAMEWCEQLNIYTLHISKNYPSGRIPDHLIVDIQKWFKDNIECAVNNSCLSRESKLWKDLLGNCCAKISKYIVEACNGDNSSEKIFNLSRVSSSVEYLVLSPQNVGLVEARKVFLEIISSLKKFFYGPHSIESKISKPGRANGGSEHPLRYKDVASREPIDFLHDITHVCFELVESHGGDLNALHDELQAGLKEWEGRKLLRNIHGLIYTISKYLRAWYDIVRFKIHSSSAILCINFNLGLNRKSRELTLDFSKFLERAIEIGILEKEKEDTLRKWYHIKDHPICGSSHCEMQMLEYLLTHNDANFFNYIGCSKGPCWLCYYILSSMTSQFKMGQSHFKLYPSWLPPEFTKCHMQREQLIEVLKFLGEKMKRLVDLGKGKKRHSRDALPDCPNDQETFLSPREVSIDQFGRS